MSVRRRMWRGSSRKFVPAAHPLKGVFHLAMVIDDAPLGALTRERMRTVMAPKAHGAWLLHEGTRDLDLDCFVMFSSVSSIFGNPAQANYAAANAFLDSLAHHRCALGLPALAINWGVLGGEGYVARNERVAEFLARQGTVAPLAGEVMALLESFLTAGVTQVDGDPRGLEQMAAIIPRLAGKSIARTASLPRSVEGQESGARTSDWRLKIESAAPDEREGIIGQALREVVGSVLRVKPESLREDQPLTDLGLDSLMTVEIENSIESAIGVALPPASLMRARTIAQIVTLIAEHMGGTTAGGSSTAPVLPPEPAPAEEVDLEALSDEEIHRLLGDEAAPDSKERALETLA